MRQSTLITVLAGAASTIAVPLLDKRADFNAPPGGDITILNYALTLEYLERKFYQEGVANYTKEDFCNAGLPEVSLPTSLSCSCHSHGYSLKT